MAKTDKSTITYGVVKEKYIFRGKVRTSYGIAAYADAEEDGTATIVASVHDITTEREDAELMAETFNAMQLEPAELKAAVTKLM